MLGALLFAVRSGGGRACEEVDCGASCLPLWSDGNGEQRQQCSRRSASAQVTSGRGDLSNRSQADVRIYSSLADAPIVIPVHILPRTAILATGGAERAALPQILFL